MALTEDQLKKYTDLINQKTDESSATDEELQSLLEAHKALSPLTTKTSTPDIDKFAAEIKARLDKEIANRKIPGVNDASVKSAANLLATRIANNQGSNLDLNFAEDIANTSPNSPSKSTMLQLRQLGIDTIPEFAKTYQSNIPAYTKNLENPTYPNANQDIQRIQNLLNTRSAQRTQDNTINSFIGGLPDELSASRENFLGGEEDRAVGAYQDYVPQALSSLNARGMLFSGDVNDELSTRALNVQSALEDERIKAEAEDNQFYADAAYQNQLRKSLQSNTDYGSAIESERQRILTERNNRFSDYQTGLDTTLDEQLQRDDAARKLALEKQRLQAQKDAADSSKTGDLLGNILGNATQIAVTKGLSSTSSGGTNNNTSSGGTGSGSSPAPAPAVNLGRVG